MKTHSICSVDITKENGCTAHAVVRFPAKMRYASQLNMLLLQHDAAHVLFDKFRAANDNSKLYNEVNQ